MKKFIIIQLIFFCTNLIYAQQDFLLYNKNQPPKSSSFSLPNFYFADTIDKNFRIKETNFFTNKENSWQGETKTKTSYEKNTINGINTTIHLTTRFDNGIPVSKTTIEVEKVHAENELKVLTIQVNEVFDQKSSTWAYKGKQNTIEILDKAGNSKFIETLIHYWQDGKFLNFQRMTTSVDNDGVRTSITEEWDGSKWIEVAKDIYSSSLSSCILTLYVYVNNKWEPKSRTTTLTDPSTADPIETITEKWTGSNWIYDTKEKFIYKLGEKEQILKYLWNDRINDWNPLGNRKQFEYGPTGYSVTDQYETANNEWKNTGLKLIYFTDAYGNNTEYIMQSWINDNYQNLFRWTYLWDQITSIDNYSEVVPIEFKLINYPNPFNPVTKIRLSIPEAIYVELSIFDLLGREIVKISEGNLDKGEHEFMFNASGYASGIYFCNLKSKKYSLSKRILLVK